MRLTTLILITLSTLVSCASDPAAPQDTSSNSGQNSTSDGLSPAERQALKARQDLLAEAASHGIYPETSPCSVTLYDHRSGLRIGFHNEASVTSKEYYSSVRNDASVKVVSDLNMGAFLKQLEESLYFKHAKKGMIRTRGAATSIVLKKGDVSYTLSSTHNSPKSELELVQDCSAAVRGIYDSAVSFQLIENNAGGAIFDQEVERIRADLQNR